MMAPRPEPAERVMQTTREVWAAWTDSTDRPRAKSNAESGQTTSGQTLGWVELLRHVLSRRQALLVAVLRQAMQENLGWDGLQQRTGWSRQHVYALASQRRQLSNIEEATVQALSLWLGWPPLVVKACAGKFTLADCFTADEWEALPQRMAQQLQRPALAGVSPALAAYAGVLADAHAERRPVFRQLMLNIQLLQAPPPVREPRH